MRYRARKAVNGKAIRDSRGGVWEYIGKKEYRALEETERKIYGDFRKKGSQDAERRLVGTDDSGNKHSIGIYRYSSSMGWTETVGGYIPIAVRTEEGEQNGYVRVIKPALLKPLLAVLAVLIAALAVFLSWYIPNNREKVPGLDEAAVAYHIEGMVNDDPSRIMIPSLTTMTLDAGQTDVEYVLFNPEGNPCYFRYQMVLSDTGETLYESGLIEPGTAVINWDLGRGLEPGTYQAEMRISTYSTDDIDTQMNSGVVSFTVEVS